MSAGDAPIEGHYTRELTPLFLFREAAQTFRDRFRRIIAIGIGIAIVSSVLNTLVERLIDNYDDRLAQGISIGLLLVGMLATGANSFGSTFLSGVLDRTVGEHQHGHEEVTIGHALRTLPFTRLITADMMVTLLRFAALFLFGLPGLIVMTLTAIVGPVVNIEGRGAWSAFVRSIQLTRRCFWLVFVSVTLPLAGEGVLSHLLEQVPLVHESIAGFIVAGLVLEVPLALFVSLVEVTLAYHLIERDSPGTVSGRR